MTRGLWIVGMLFAVLALPAMATAETIATATFADGKGDIVYNNGALTTNNSVTTAIDAFTGMGGGGWADGWGWGCGGSSKLTVKVLGTDDTGYNQLVDGNYQSYSMYYSGTSTRHSGVWRDYTAGVDPSDPHTIQFTVRIDEDLTYKNFSTTNDRYEIHDRVDYEYYNSSGSLLKDAYAYTGGYSTWGISLIGNNKQWRIRSSSGDVDTGVWATTGTAYTFTVDFRPDLGANGLFNVKIDSGGETLFASTGGYELNAAASDDVGGPYTRQATGRLLFSTFLNKDTVSGVTDTANTRQWSIDAITIAVPEPTALAMALGILLTSLVWRRRG